ncbi:hypothetical protein [Paenibacillus antri]|uniref:hypothetical protein n=1 Tax=Paenibacillus antri TaxID=2582848 RepID=UPI0013051817|nr:hypothetical protein [Paenibacillus antri]
MTISLLLEKEIGGTVVSAIITAIPIIVIRLTSKKLKKIQAAKEEERRWSTPEQFTLVVIREREDEIDERTEDIADRLFEMDNLGSIHECSIDEVREVSPRFHVDRFPTYLIVNDSPDEDLAEMLGHVRAQGTEVGPLLRFLEEEMWKHELKLRRGREVDPSV